MQAPVRPRAESDDTMNPDKYILPEQVVEAERLALRARRGIRLAMILPLTLWAVGLVLLTVSQPLFWASCAASLLALYLLTVCVVNPRIRATREYIDALRNP